MYNAGWGLSLPAIGFWPTENSYKWAVETTTADLISAGNNFAYESNDHVSWRTILTGKYIEAN